MMSKELLIRYSSEKENESMSRNSLLELARIMSVREILSDESCPYKAAFDAKLKLIHYYTTNSKGQYTMETLKDKYLPITNQETVNALMPSFSKELEPVELNKDETYVLANIFAGGDGQTTVNENSALPRGVIFVPKEDIYEYVATQLKSFGQIKSKTDRSSDQDEK